MKFYLKCFLYLLCLLLPVGASAQDVTCLALDDAKTYQDNKSYKKLIAGHDGWVFRTHTDFQDDFELNDAGMKRFSRLQQAFKHQSIELVIALLPTRGMMHADQVISDDFDQGAAWNSYNKLAQQIRDTGISVAVVEQEETSNNFFYKRDHHWNSSGAKMMAQAVAQQVKAIPVYDSFNKESFVTEKAGADEQKGTFSKFINKTCDFDLEGERVDLYKTVSDTDLFGDIQSADIVLIGTSNSTQNASKANFDGFLKEYIGADVDNRSVSGGGADTAFYQWLHSDDYQIDKPKVVIWEIPVYQSFDDDDFFRQLIPAIHGGCIEKTVATEEVAVAQKVSLFSDVWSAGSSTEAFYANLTFSDKELNKLRVVAKYENGKKDVLGIRRSKFYQNDGVFFYEFNNEGDAVTELSLTLPKKLTGTVKAELCAYSSLD